MPEGPEIFETSGAWEDFSTPSRDLRILIAIDVVRGFPARVARRPERFAMPPGKSAEGRGGRARAHARRELAARKLTYTRTDGSPFTLTLAEVLAAAARSRWPTTPTTASSAVGRAGEERGGVDLQAACAGRAARSGWELPRVVPRATPPGGVKRS